MDSIIKFIIIAICLSVFYRVISLYRKTEKSSLDCKDRCALAGTGFLANLADTLGLGSFAVIVALNNRFKIIDDQKLPGTLNAHSILPAMLQSLLFLNFVEIDISLLILFVLSACAGGFLSGFLVAKMDKKTIRQLMCWGFTGISIMLLAEKLHLLPLAGFNTSLPPYKMAIGAAAMVCAGMLPAIGAGLYVPIQAILFLLGLSPLAAFPIMTTTGAIVQTTTAAAFIVRKEFAVKESLYLAFSGILGVAIAVPAIANVNLSTLRWLLLVVTAYNAFMLWKSTREEKTKLIHANS